MPSPDGYLLNEADVKFLQEMRHRFERMQRYVNAFGREPEDKIEHEDIQHNSEIYIALAPVGGIPANVRMGTTGIGDTPGSADCLLFTIPRGNTTTDALPNGALLTVYNFGSANIDEGTWIVTVRDKHGRWVALPVESGSGSTGTISGPGWTAGLSNEDCLTLTVSNTIGKCIDVDDTQVLTMVSDDGVIWYSTALFNYTGGSGLVVLTRPDCQALPTLQIDGFCLIWESSGTDGSGNCYIEYKGGTDLCGDGPGTTDGEGAARGSCCSNTFTIRLTCGECPAFTCCQNPVPADLRAVISGSTGTCTFNGTEFTLTEVAADTWQGTTTLPGMPQPSVFLIICTGHGTWEILTNSTKTTCDFTATVITEGCGDSLASFLVTMTECCTGTFVVTVYRA